MDKKTILKLVIFLQNHLLERCPQGYAAFQQWRAAFLLL